MSLIYKLKNGLLKPMTLHMLTFFGSDFERRPRVFSYWGWWVSILRPNSFLGISWKFWTIRFRCYVERRQVFHSNPSFKYLPFSSILGSKNIVFCHREKWVWLKNQINLVITFCIFWTSRLWCPRKKPKSFIEIFFRHNLIASEVDFDDKNLACS